MFGCWIVWPISQTVTPRFASHLGAEMPFERFLEQKTSCQNRWCPNLCIYNEAIHGNNFRLACLVAQVQFLAAQVQLRSKLASSENKWYYTLYNIYIYAKITIYTPNSHDLNAKFWEIHLIIPTKIAEIKPANSGTAGWKPLQWSPPLDPASYRPRGRAISEDVGKTIGKP